MKLLILTQKVDKDDDVLGFFHQWIKLFASHYEYVTVICLEKGQHELPPNVKILSLGKEAQLGTFTYVRKLFTYVWQERKNYDEVFVHMNVEYVVLCGLLWRLMSKRIGLWYIHRSVTTKLKIAEKLADVIYTSSPEGFRIPSTKVMYVKHGIDFSLFDSEYKPLGNPLTITHIGRITPIKNCDTLIEALHLLKIKYKIPARVVFVGKAITDSDKEYEHKLHQQIQKHSLESEVEFVGGVSYQELPKYIMQTDITVNLTPSGGMDKAVLESLVGMRPVFVSNTAFLEVFKNYAYIFMFGEKNQDDLAQKIYEFRNINEQRKIIESLQKDVVKNFSLDTLILTIITHLHA